MNNLLGLSIHNFKLNYIELNNYNNIQICHKFSDINKLSKLIKFLRNSKVDLIYHAPVFYDTNPNITYYLHKNEKLRDATFEMLDSNLKMAKSLKAKRNVVHFASSYENNELNEEETLVIANESAKRLNDLSKEYDIPILLEYSGYNDKFYKTDSWIEIINENKNLGICLDVGHLYITCQTFGLDYFKEIEKLTPYTELIHLWNTRGVSDVVRYGHIAVHKDQNPKDGWIDIERVLRIILSYKEVPIIAEPDFYYSGITYFEEGMNWINDLVNEIVYKNQKNKAV